MKEQDKAFFELLTEDRMENARVMEKQSMGGVKRTVVEKYSDQAHFIYELLQNADDAKATEAHFELYEDRLVFRHNGTRHFRVSDPKLEAEDTKQGRCGDINAITSIGNSNKTTAQIGKFGVGFKAVFQYTSEPEIYDAYYQFKIERLVVPQLLDHDYPGRKKNETVFVFPFKDKDMAYKDISSKLKKLSYPILFLEHLKKLDFTIGEEQGHYDKSIDETADFSGTILEKLTVQNTIDGEDSLEHFWMFSRQEEHGFRYCVGFFLNEDGKLTPKELPAFCFFKTKEVTHLNFIVHAPFLLTDSREGIMAGEDYNRQLIQKLAQLAADSILIMRDLENQGHRMVDDDIVTIIPISRNDFGGDEDDVISFMPFYGCILEDFLKEDIIPTEGGYVSKENAYWAMTADIQKVFSQEPLRQLTGNEEAAWVFQNLKRGSGYVIESYVKSIVRDKIGDEEIFDGITEDFIVAQPMEWLHVFYKWIAANRDRMKLARWKPVLLDQDGKAATASELFLPEENMTGYRFVHADLLRQEDTRKFLENLDLKKPTIFDFIHQHVIPSLKRQDETLAVVNYFIPLFIAYRSCKWNEVDTFIREIKNLKIVPCVRLSDSKESRVQGCMAYFPDSNLMKILKYDPEALVLKYEELVELIKKICLGDAETDVRRFFRALGVKDNFGIKEVTLFPPYPDYFPHPHTTWENRASISYSEAIVPCFNRALEHIVHDQEKDVSLALWKALFFFLKTNANQLKIPAKYIFGRLTGTCKYFFHAPRRIEFESSNQRKLRTLRWLLNNEDEWVAPTEITADDLPECYERDDEYFDLVAEFIGLKKEAPKVIEEEPKAQLTEEQQKKIAFADKLVAAGITSSEKLEEILEIIRKEKARTERREHVQTQVKEPRSGVERPSVSGIATSVQASEKREVLEVRYSDDEAENQVVRDVVRRSQTKRQAHGDSEGNVRDASSDLEAISDCDDLMPAMVSSERQVERLTQRQADDLSRARSLLNLQKQIAGLTTYSYGWFKALLKLESMCSYDTNPRSREVAIDFGKVERDPNAQRTLLLKHPSRYIPQFMEELSDISLVLHLQEGTVNLVIEAANVQSYTLKVKVKPGTNLENLDVAAVQQASISAKSPQFLLDELKERFMELGEEGHFSDRFDMKQNLPENIKFIFGPPGTGKTTHLAQEELIPLMEKDAKPCRVLVLTPTNKSADVLVRKVMEVSGEHHGYKDWLVRFGVTADEAIERSGLYKDRTMDPRVKGKNVTVTTIARFPYDYFMVDGSRLHLRDINWDYIVIDEASMIPLANIIYPLYKKSPMKFIIAGDPFQIEPIVSVDTWKYETIYTMVKLDSFKNPVTEPHDYEVKLLTTQYRSIPEVGEIFSRFAYDGILGHHREAGSQKPLNWGADTDISSLNIIKFPVSKYESIYKAKQLQHSSSYHVYAALFTYELVRHLSGRLSTYNPGRIVSMGVIAPYKAQADMIDRLLSRESFPPGITVHVGTIHGFQGDECDIIFTVFNPPPAISTSEQMFLNKRNIINVSISRARDCLFVLMPDDDTENVNNLSLVKRVESLLKESENCKESSSSEWEELMFQNPRFLEENTFSTNHQSVNVYGAPEQRYEVRTEDQAVDVQIHERPSSEGK